ncbi:hypothetical protein Ae201684P_002205 [Aphanomyces euteiches]|uniref:N-acetyltransferase domain-containing protein n=1 Tax=Aphanomyces euteiches TaxID=100861 RepID=A0A6G0XJZ7_9STRA|nr:hypothetical protein Ae201684_004029 [Aphanomyces euteiches]KAH9084973.1 hypothetical protein Ae201684P_002205 [Aphanomyces euteiches]KAH9144319.1 hypothetical protein AeRB84_011721 [Aphanomyces euteiches]
MGHNFWQPDMTYQVHQASVADVDEVAPLFDAYRVFYKQPSDLPRAKRFLHDRLSSNESVVFFATDENGTAVGFVQLYPSFSSVTTERVWVLNDLYVAATARRNGVAKLLMNRARDFVQERQDKGLTLETGADNLSAQALYESLGYVKETSIHYFLSCQ